MGRSPAQDSPDCRGPRRRVAGRKRIGRRRVDEILLAPWCRSNTCANHRRGSERSPSPASAHQARLPPRPASIAPVTERCRRPWMANAPPPKPTSQRAGVSRSRLPSHPRRSQTLTDMRRAVRLSSSCDEFSGMVVDTCKIGDTSARIGR